MPVVEEAPYPTVIAIGGPIIPSAIIADQRRRFV
jgi:hypothetical protein